MTFLRAAAAVAGKDLRIESRGRYAVGAVLPFAATLLIAFGLSLGPGRLLLQRTAPGLLWLAILFAAVLACRRAYESETADGALEGLLLAPVDKAAVYLGKAAAVAAQLFLLEVIVLILVAGLFDVRVLGGNVPVLAAAFALGTIGLAAVGALFGALDASARAREAVFPLLVLPLAVPVLVAGVKTTQLALGDAPGWSSWLGLLVAFDLIVLSAGTLVFGHVLED